MSQGHSRKRSLELSPNVMKNNSQEQGSENRFEAQSKNCYKLIK